MTFIPSTTNIKSTVNSTTTLLTASSIFVGTAELNALGDVMVSLKTDQNGTLFMEFSEDGTNWDSSISFLYDTARINAPHILVKGNRYYRTRFENTSTTDQTYLRLETFYGSFNKLTAPIDGTLSENFDALATRPTNYNSEVAMGHRQGRVLWNKFGYNADVDSAAPEVIASWGGTFVPLTTATTISIVSTDATDDDGNTGCNSVVLYGVDTNRDEVIEVVTLNGTTPVVTTSTWLGLNRVAMFLCGTGKINAGTITASSTGAGTPIMAQMPADGGVTQQCIFHIPRNHTFLTELLHINVLNRAKDAELRIKLWVYSTVNNGNQEVFRADIDTTKTNELDIIPNLPFPISESSVMWLECETNKNDIIINARFDGILERIA